MNRIESYLKSAEENYLIRNYPLSFASFVKYFENIHEVPANIAPNVQATFERVVLAIVNTLTNSFDNIELILKVLFQALDIFPDDLMILNSLGSFLCKVGDYDNARNYLEYGVQLDHNNLSIEKNLMYCKWQQIPRWHFKMLNDKIRNTAYYKTIVQRIKEGYSKVIDIGSGCGLLSIYASQCNATMITAFEENQYLCKICEDVLQENNIQNVELIHSNSTNSERPPGEANLIVTEIFDVGLFGENMLQSLVHAHDTLITEKSFTIIPCRAKLYVRGINYKDHQCFRFNNSIPEINLTNTCIRQYTSEPYDAEDMSIKNYIFITNIEIVFDINLCDIKQLKLMLFDKEFQQNITLKCTSTGPLDALLCWFDLYLDEYTKITSDPNNDNRVKCWEQALIHLPHPITLQENQQLDFKVTVLNSRLQFSPNEELVKNCSKCWFVPKETVSFLNDKNLVEHTLEVAKKFNFAKNMNVFDDSLFPLFGLILAKQGCKVFTLNHETDENYIEFLNHVLSLNSIPKENLLMTLDSPLKIDSQTPCHICYHIPVDINGTLSYSLEQPKTVIMPEILHINLVLICSESLEIFNKIQDDNVLGFKVAKFFNDYSGNEHPDIDHLNYTAISDTLVYTLDSFKSEELLEFNIKQNGHINGIYTWYDLDFDGELYSTLKSHHYKKCAYIFDTKEVKAGHRIKIQMRIQETLLDFKYK